MFASVWYQEMFSTLDLNVPVTICFDAQCLYTQERGGDIWPILCWCLSAGHVLSWLISKDDVEPVSRPLIKYFDIIELITQSDGLFPHQGI